MLAPMYKKTAMIRPYSASAKRFKSRYYKGQFSKPFQNFMPGPPAIDIALLKAFEQELSKKTSRSAEDRQGGWKPSQAPLSFDQMKLQLAYLPVKDETKLAIRQLLIQKEDPELLERLNLIFGLPWNIESKDTIDLSKAKQTLDAEHYGMSDVKERILDLLAIKKLTEHTHKHAAIWCLVGKPGVGKTAICRAIAESMNKKYARIALGGVADEAIIRGYTPSYKSAAPGRIIQELKRVGTCNPLMVFDEIDKVTANSNGSAEAALLEVFDPEQNTEFYDHYVGVPFDLSKITKIATANYPEKIPAPLKDRMEIIEVRNYSVEEKIEIAQRHLIKKVCDESGLENRGFELSNDCLRTIIEQYTHEAGVRQLTRTIKHLCGKYARALVEQKELPQFKSENLKMYLGKPHKVEDVKKFVW